MYRYDMNIVLDNTVRYGMGMMGFRLSGAGCGDVSVS